MADDADKKPRKVAITNNDVGPRYAFTSRGMEVVQSGETLSTEMRQVQIDSLDDEYVVGTDDAPRWTVQTTKQPTDAGADQGKALDGLPVAKLRSIADAEGVALTGRKDPASGADLPDLTSGKDIAAAILAHRSAN